MWSFSGHLLEDKDHSWANLKMALFRTVRPAPLFLGVSRLGRTCWLSTQPENMRSWLGLRQPFQIRRQGWAAPVWLSGSLQEDAGASGVSFFFSKHGQVTRPVRSRSSLLLGLSHLKKGDTSLISCCSQTSGGTGTI